MAVSLGRTILILTLFALTAGLQGCDGFGSGGDGGGVSDDLAPPVDDFPESVIAALPDGATIETLRQGRDQYGVCAVCHGADAEGTQLGPPFRDAQWVHSDGTVDGIEEVVRAGIARPRDFPVPMPPMGGGAFDDEQVRALSTYVYALSLGG